MDVLVNFYGSRTMWLLATSHNVVTNEALAEIGGFRPLNLLIEPFSFVPADQIEDPPGSGRILGVWSRSMIGKALESKGLRQ